MILYVVFGVLTTLVNFGVFWIFTKILGESLYLFNNAVAWVAGVVFAFVTNKLFVFESKSFDKKTLAKELISFVSARIATFFIDSALMFLLVTVMSVNEMISKILVQIIVVILNYVFSKLFVFKNSKGD